MACPHCFAFEACSRRVLASIVVQRKRERKNEATLNSVVQDPLVRVVRVTRMTMMTATQHVQHAAQSGTRSARQTERNATRNVMRGRLHVMLSALSVTSSVMQSVLSVKKKGMQRGAAPPLARQLVEVLGRCTWNAGGSISVWNTVHLHLSKVTQEMHPCGFNASC